MNEMDDKISNLKYTGSLLGDIKFYLNNPMNILFVIGLLMIYSGFIKFTIVFPMGFVVTFLSLLLWREFL